MCLPTMPLYYSSLASFFFSWFH
uniref:Uncharacterized protein n=1 Tax=Arundo donax TaxID=35708 RepID=A0A0A9HN77_ARUDO